MGWETIGAALAAFLGGGGLVKLLEHLAGRRRDDAKADSDARQQAHEQLLQFVAKLEARIDFLERQHGDCQRENAALREQVGGLREAVARLEADLREAAK